MTQPPGNYPPPPPAGGGGLPPQQPAGAQPSNNLVLAILTTVFCCPPLGIVSIVKAAQVNGLWAQGRFAEAEASAAAAKKWAIWAVVAGVVLWIIQLILFAMGALTFDMNTSTY